ncbi:hypothetical protein [Reichenbachiella sp.]
MKKDIIFISVLLIIGLFVLIASHVSEMEYQMYFSRMQKLDSIAGTADPKKREWLDSLIHFENKFDSLRVELHNCRKDKPNL